MFQRLRNLIRGFFGLFIGGLERGNPEALLEVEKENLRRQISEFNQGLAAHAGLVERLMAHNRKLQAREDELKARTIALNAAGNLEEAGKAALAYKQADEEQNEVARQLGEAEARYKELVHARDVSVKAARDKIESLRRGIDDMKVQKAMAELNEMAASMVGTIGGSGDTLNRLEEQIEDARTKAAGRARVARDSVDLSGVALKAGEQSAMEKQALADFLAAQDAPLVKTTQPTLLLEADVISKNSLDSMLGTEQEKSLMGPISQ